MVDHTCLIVPQLLLPLMLLVLTHPTSSITSLSTISIIATAITDLSKPHSGVYAYSYLFVCMLNAGAESDLAFPGSEKKTWEGESPVTNQFGWVLINLLLLGPTTVLALTPQQPYLQ